jgi:hypothetical protein
LPELSVSESERYFSLAETRFERWLPLQAVRGLVEFGSESAASVQAALFPEFSAGHERASAAQMERLQLKYGDRSAVTSRLPGAQTVAVPPASPAVAESVVVSAGAAVRPGVVGGTRRADISTLELLQQQVVTRLRGLGGTLEPGNLWQALSESMVCQLLRGRRMALVGGIVNQRAREKIERAFGLQYLRWIPASKKDRVKDLEPSVRDVDLLVLVTSIIGHKHNELRSVCVALGIPWVQLPKGSGYGVNQLAHVILQQASRRLRETLAEAG